MCCRHLTRYEHHWSRDPYRVHTGCDDWVRESKEVQLKSPDIGVYMKNTFQYTTDNYTMKILTLGCLICPIRNKEDGCLSLWRKTQDRHRDGQHESRDHYRFSPVVPIGNAITLWKAMNCNLLASKKTKFHYTTAITVKMLFFSSLPSGIKKIFVIQFENNSMQKHENNITVGIEKA